MNQIKLFIFDLDGVITNTAKLHYLAWKKTFKEHFKIDLEPYYINKVRGVSRINAAKLILCDYKIDDKVTDDHIQVICEEKNSYYIKLLSEINREYILEGILETLEYLKNNKFYIALGSVSENANYIVKQLDIYHYFDYIVNPKTLKNPKPDPEIFVNAQQHFNLSSEQCIVIEDSLAGVTSAQQAQIKAIGINIEADYTIKSTKELLNLIIKILNNKQGEI